MADEKVTLEQSAVSPPTITIKPAEPVYVLPPHPEAHIVTNEETAIPEEPSIAEETLDDLIQQAVAGMRGELLQELQISRGGELNVKG